MLCSVIIPTVGRPTLDRAIASVLEQDVDWSEYEVIVVNDSGLPLATTDLLADRRVRVLTVNRVRLNFACNAGASVAAGRYVKFLHDDDYLLPGGLAALVSVAEETGADWVAGGAVVVDENGLELYTMRRPGLHGNALAPFTVGEGVHMSQCLLNRASFLRVGGFDPTVTNWEDRDLEARLCLDGTVASANEVVACERVSLSSGSMYDASTGAENHRRIRERVFDTWHVLSRLSESVRSDVHLRGRLARGYVFSAALNALQGRLWVAGSRVTCALRMSSWHVVQPALWKGVLHKRKSVKMPRPQPDTQRGK